MSILSELKLHPCLRARTHQVCRPPKPADASSSASITATSSSSATNPDDLDGFVLYIPTVCLRYEQNPSFALACHAANHLHIPLVVLAIVVDDTSHACPAHPHRFPPTNTNSNSSSPSPALLSSSVVMTSRRLAFTLQALSHACSLWSAHGAAVGIRIHAGSGTKGARTPDHLTLASRASLVVMDEPFVSPFTTLVHRVEEACRRSNVECVRVDGSCTVPPVQVLKKKNTINNSKMKYDGGSAKAYLWQNKTEHLRESHLKAAIDGYFDAPELDVKMEDEDLFLGKPQEGASSAKAFTNEGSIGQRLAHLFPPRWKPTSGTSSSSLPSAPDVRPFTSRELCDLYQNDDYVLDGSPGNDIKQHQQSKQDHKIPFHNFVVNWPGADPTVPPCPQTIGTSSHGMHRWNTFVQKGGLLRYGKERNDARKVHSVSRMSAYLNLGIVSIFRLVWEVKQQQAKSKASSNSTSQQQQAKSNSKWNKSGADKMEEEIVKWREFSYAHAFAREDYDDVGSLPPWSVTCLNNYPNRRKGYTLEQLANGTTGDAKWNAMQQYLVRTGELHNNVRMTWGKTVAEWVGSSSILSPSALNDNMCSISPAQLTLRTLCYLNDRYALDGLSPPSYAGLLWCMGWTEKPTSGSSEWTIPKKPAHRYKMNPEEFRMAEQKLLSTSQSIQYRGASVSGSSGASGKSHRSVLDMMKMQASNGSTANATSKDNHAESKRNTEDSESSSATKRIKRNGSVATIDSFFSKDPKKRKRKEIVDLT